MASYDPDLEAPPDVVFEAVIRPNRSMNARHSAVFIICLTALSLAIALGFFSMGLWLVLPFAGLEVLIVGAAIGYSLRRSQGYEWVVITDRDVSVLISEFGRSQRYNFQRYWTQVKLERAPSRLRPDRLLLGSHGRFVEVGREFVDQDRKEFAVCLAEAVRGGRNQNFKNASEA